jgi:hypothetical protein
MAPPPNKGKKEVKGKPPPIDKLIVPAIGLAIGIVAFQFIKGIIRADVSIIVYICTMDDMTCLIKVQLLSGENKHTDAILFLFIIISFC